MSDNGSASARGGTGLLAAGLVAVGLLVAGAVTFLRQTAEVDEGAVTAVIQPAAPATQATPESAEVPLETAERKAPEAVGKSQEEGTLPSAEDLADAETTDVPEPEAEAPSVDEVRVEPSGAMVVAGRAVPGARVDVLVDGDVVASTEADDSGSFAALGTVSAQDGARSLTLRSGEGVTAIASAEEIILAPVTPRAVARATEQSDDTANAAKGALVATAPPEDTTGTDAINSALPASRSDLKSDPETEEKKDVVAALTEDSDANPVAETKVESEVDAVTAGQADGVETSDRPQDVTENAPVAAPEPVKNEERASEDGQRIAVLRSDEDGVTLVPSEPVRPASVILDTISYGDDGAVRLAGRASADATEVRAYLDNVPVARMPIIDGGAWRGTVEGVEPGVYTLRIDAVDEEDTVTARIETPFKREAPATLAAAAASQSGPIRSVTVQAGDTLWAIARQRYGEGLLYVQVYDANRSAIRDPDLIYPGQVFELPVE